jgi:uncharacterized membrane protein YhaH (DUF805 family)
VLTIGSARRVGGPTVTNDGQSRRSVYSYVAVTALCIGSVLYFAQDMESWVRPVRLVLLLTALAAFAVEAWRLREQRRGSRWDDNPHRLGWLGALIVGWLVVGIAVSEFFDQPFSLVRVAVKLALACFLTVFFVWLYARLEGRR